MVNLVIFNVEIFIVMKISKLSSLYATNEMNPSTYQRTPSGKGLRPSFRPFCTIFPQPHGAVTKLFEFCNSPVFCFRLFQIFCPISSIFYPFGNCRIIVFFYSALGYFISQSHAVRTVRINMHFKLQPIIRIGLCKAQ